MSNKLIRKFKINGCPTEKEFNSLSFGQQIDHLRKMREFQESSKHTWVSQKRISSTKAVAEAKKLFDAKEYYCQFHDSPDYRDDSFEFWYRA